MVSFGNMIGDMHFWTFLWMNLRWKGWLAFIACMMPHCQCLFVVSPSPWYRQTSHTFMQVTLSGSLSRCIGFYPLTFELAMVSCRKGENKKNHEKKFEHLERRASERKALVTYTCRRIGRRNMRDSLWGQHSGTESKRIKHIIQKSSNIRPCF